MMNHFRSVSRLMRKFAGRGFLFTFSLLFMTAKEALLSFAELVSFQILRVFWQLGLSESSIITKKKNHSHLNMSHS